MLRLILHTAGISLLLCLTGCNGGDGGSAASSSATALPVAQTQARPRRARLARSPEPTPVASETLPPFTQSVFLKKNLAFDAMRNHAIESLYAGNTLQAMAIVKAAQKLRPHDPSIAYWLQAVESGQVPDRSPTHGRLVAPLLPKPSVKPKDKAPTPLLLPPSFVPTLQATSAAAPATPVSRVQPGTKRVPQPRRTPVAHSDINPNLLD